LLEIGGLEEVDLSHTGHDLGLQKGREVVAELAGKRLVDVPQLP
jgi:hypothetical protein